MKPAQQKAIISRLVEAELGKIRLQIIRAMMAATLLTLHDKHDWKPEQLVEVMKQIFAQFDLVADKYVTLDDFYKVCTELGIEIVDDVNGGAA